MNTLNTLIDTANGWLYGYILIALLVAGGIYFTIRLQFLPTTLLKEAIRTLLDRNKADLAWNISDFIMGIMALINIPVCVILGKRVYKALWDYMIQRNEGKDPIFDPKAVLGSVKGMECWTK